MRVHLRLICVAVLAAACGSRSPAAPDPPSTPTFDYITLAEYDGYLNTLQAAFSDVQTMITEFGAIGSDLSSGAVSDYWLSEFTKNLIRRVENIQARAREIRPRHAELLKLHVEEYEAALSDFHRGFDLFAQGLTQPGTVSVEEVNGLIVSGNVHLIRLQILLGDLGGRYVDLFAGPQGSATEFEPDL